MKPFITDNKSGQHSHLSLMPESDYFLGSDVVGKRLKDALQFKTLDRYIFTHDMNYCRQMAILRNAMLLRIISKSEGMELKVRAMVDAIARIGFLSKETADKNLWAEWEEFGKMKDTIDEVLRDNEKKWGELGHKLGFESKKNK